MGRNSLKVMCWIWAALIWRASWGWWSLWSGRRWSSKPEIWSRRPSEGWSFPAAQLACQCHYVSYNRYQHLESARGWWREWSRAATCCAPEQRWCASPSGSGRRKRSKIGNITHQSQSEDILGKIMNITAKCIVWKNVKYQVDHCHHESWSISPCFRCSLHRLLGSRKHLCPASNNPRQAPPAAIFQYFWTEIMIQMRYGCMRGYTHKKI